MLESERCEQTSARRPLQEPFLDQEWLDDVLDRVARLRQRRRDRIHTDRTAGIIRRNGREISPVHGVETGGIDLKRGERAVGSLAVDGLGAVNVRKVTHAAQQTAGDARCATCTARNFVGAVGRNADPEHARTTVDNLFELFRRYRN